MEVNSQLVGGFNPFEKYEPNWKSSPNRDENKKSLKPQPSLVVARFDRTTVQGSFW